ncbi:MAG: hypothetical protein PHU23_15410 [Dehalococcoidales bacterium]|nr:hypothetical protein [Dehalococcoidales bacterium]
MKILIYIYMALMLVGLLFVTACQTNTGETHTSIPTTACTNHVNTSTEIEVSSSIGIPLKVSQKVSGVLLKDIQIFQGTSDEYYMSPVSPSVLVYPNDPILVITGIIQNIDNKNTYINLNALGYNEAGETVAWTFYKYNSIYGKNQFILESGETCEISLHLNFPENIKSIIISANSFSVTSGATPQPSTTPTITDQQPIDIISVEGPLTPINPGGPIVELTVMNVSNEPVVSLNATLEKVGIRAYTFTFNVSSSNPLLPDKSISSRLTLIGGGFSDNVSYPLTINGTLQGGVMFAYVRQVLIISPWELLNPPIGIEIPKDAPVIATQLDFVMRGEFDKLYLYSDGTVVYVEEKNLRMPIPENPPVRIWSQGQIDSQELNGILSLFQTSEFAKLDDYYQFPGKPMDPIPGMPAGGFTMGDGRFTFFVKHEDGQKVVTAFGYLTPDKGLTYLDMPYPLDEIYKRLRAVIDNKIQEVYREPIKD